jgi:hypothetical protein
MTQNTEGRNMGSFGGVPINPDFITCPNCGKHWKKCKCYPQPRRKRRMPFPKKNALLSALTEARDLTIKTREGHKWEILYYALSICIDIELDSPNSLKHDLDKLANAATIHLSTAFEQVKE